MWSLMLGEIVEARLSRGESMSAIVMLETPWTARAAAVRIPTAPAPSTKAEVPARDPAGEVRKERFMAWRDTASGSTRAPCSKVTLSGSTWHIEAGWLRV